MSSVDYLVRNVAAGDGRAVPVGSPLTRYYAAEGYPPGTWLGSGLNGLAASERVGAEVTEEQLRSLFEEARSPFTGAALGKAPAKYPTRAERVQRRVGSLPASMPAEARGKAVDRILAEEQDTKTRKAVAGFDLTFSVPKSVSVLWAVADHGLQVQFYEAHRAALASTLRLIEREALFTRLGSQGARRVRINGAVAAAFDHWDSRKGDPQLHTHVTVANRVQGPDGGWRTIDSASLYRSAVAFSETYNCLLADEVTRRVGMTWESRERGRGRRVAREIHGVPDSLIAVFSQRSADIETAVDTAVDEYEQRHGRRPSPRAMNRMRQHITLDTRDRKKPTSLSDAAASWHWTAQGVLDEDPTEWATSLVQASGGPTPVVLRLDDLPTPLLMQTAMRVVDEVSGARSTWTRWNLVAETMRQLSGMGWQFATTADTVAVRDAVVAAAEQLSVSISLGETAAVPAAFRDVDGVSEFARPVVFTSARVLGAEDALLALADDRTGPVVDLGRAERIAGTVLPGRDFTLSMEDQAPAAIQIVTSGRVVDVLVGPAGTGKTTAMAGVRAMWEAEHGPGTVVGLAPSAKAAQVLAADLGVVTDNTAQWLSQQHLQPARASRITTMTEKRAKVAHAGGDTTTLDAAVAAAWAEHDRWRLQPGQLLIVDEAGMAGTFALAALAEQARLAGAKLLLVGDPYQLSAVETGGAFGLLTASRADTPALSVVRRFTDPDGTRRTWEEHAAAGLRIGDETVLTTYAQHGRVAGGERDDMIDAAYAAWLANTKRGDASLLIAADNDTAHELNKRARTDLVHAGAVDDRTPVRLHDGLTAGRGDRIVTREIDRYLTDGTLPGTGQGRRADGFVRNGQQWIVDRARRDGSLTVRLLDGDGLPGAAAVTLPAGYVRRHVDLAYATTAYRAQGMTTDTAHVLADATIARETFYVAMTRGRSCNQAYLVLDPPTHGRAGDHQHPHGGADGEQWTRGEVMHAIVTNVGAQPSAHETIRVEQDKAGSIAQLAVEAETIAAYAHDLAAGEAVFAALGDHPAITALVGDARFDQVVKAIRAASAVGIDIPALLPGIAATLRRKGAVTAPGLADAIRAHTSAVTTAGRTPHRRLVAGLLPDATAGLTDPQMLTALRERYDLIEARADAVLDRDLTADAPWVRGLPNPTVDPAAWRATARLVAAYRDRWDVTDESPLGRAPDRTASFSQHADHRRVCSAIVAVHRPVAAGPSAQRVAPGAGREL